MVQPTPEIQLKLTTKGTYVWAITLQKDTYASEEEWVNALKHIDTKLKDAFPMYSKPGSGKSFSFDE